MATERQKFMYQVSINEFAELEKHIGEKLKFNYILNGTQISAIGTLLIEEVQRFVHHGK